MSSSAFSTDQKRGDPPIRIAQSTALATRHSRHTRSERILARLLVATLISSHPLAAYAGDELSDANNTNFDQSHVTLDNQQAGRTTFTIDTNRTTIGWQDLQQPENNRLEFDFTNGGRNAAVLNYSESINPIRISGQVVSNGTVGFANQYGVFIDGSAVIDVGSLVAIGGNVSREAFLAGGAIEIPLQGRVENHGLIRADQNVALLATSVLNAGEILAGNGNALLIGGERISLGDFDVLSAGFGGRKDFRVDLAGGDVSNTGAISSSDAALLGGRVVNLGEIEIEDGSLLMVAADAVYVTRFDNPVLIRLPRGSVGASTATTPTAGAAGDDASPRYAIENHGQIDAGQGHVRLAAADPLGFSIRQGTGTAERTARIAARTIDLEGGEQGRVHLSGELDASDRSKHGRGGEVDITGSIIALADAKVTASGTRGGGVIQIGGEQQGSGELQRARSVVIDDESEIHADATRRGDGGRVIVFSEDLTSVAGEISARGGAKGGDGGFVETSGLRHFAIDDAPDVSARRGRAGSWLIDPYDITISNAVVNCTDVNVACLDPAIDAILDPEFDSVGFDGILRTADSNPNDGINPTNYVSADLIERALGVGTNITLSTQAFGVDQGTAQGNITIEDAIRIDSARVLEGTVARLTLLAAGNIFVNANIEVLLTGGRSNLALSVELNANDSSQTAPARDFDLDLIEGNVEIDADIRTGGGSLAATGISILQSLGRQIVTLGGDVRLTSGSISPDSTPFSEERESGDPDLTDGAFDTKIELLGNIDTSTSDGRQDGGDVALIASSINLGVGQSGEDQLSMVTGFLSIVGDILTGGGSIGLSGGLASNQSSSAFAGSVEVTGLLDSDGGDIAIRANRVNPASDDDEFDVTLVAPATDPGRSDGGLITVAGAIRTAGGSLAIGNDTAKSISLDGTFDTRNATNIREHGLVKLVARDTTGVDTDDDANLYGNGQIQIGRTSATTISTAGLVARTRDLTLSDGTGANAVAITLSGESSSTSFDVTLDDDDQNDDQTSDSPLVGVLDLLGTRSVTLNQNSRLEAETIRITAAPAPAELSTAEREGQPNPPAEDDELFTRLVFGGTNGAGATPSDGVLLNADEIFLAVGDGSTATDDLFAGDLGTLASPTDFGLQRQTRGDYQGLQLRSQSGLLRPEVISLRQDADLTITQGAANAASELDLAGAFDGAVIGTEGMRLALESSDGVLTVEDAAGLNNAGPLGPGDLGRSFVALLGGLLLPDPPGGTAPDPGNSVVFRDGVAVLGTDGTTAFSVEELAISTPGDFTVIQQIADSITAVAELVFGSGRLTVDESAAGRGTLTIAAATALEASRRLSLEAGGSGFGDLVFAGPGVSLSADEIELRGGSEGESRNDDSNDLSRIVGLQSQTVSLRDAQGAVFGDGGSSAVAFRYRQAAGIDAAVDLPTLAQFGLVSEFRSAGDVEYTVRSDQGRIDLDDGIVGTNEADRFRNVALSLIGLQSGSNAAIEVSTDTAFVGKQVELGGIERFSFSAALARVFNRTGAAADESLTLRSGVGGSGSLDFESDGGTPLLVKAPTVKLIAGDGPGGDASSTINTGNASFDLAGPGGARTFAYQMDGSFQVSDLPDNGQFVGGSTGLPNVLAIRNDGGDLTIDDFDAEELPFALDGDPSRLVLEAEAIALNQQDGDDLELTQRCVDAACTSLVDTNFVLRLRANVLSLLASNSNSDNEDGRVRMGTRDTDSQPLIGTDAAFDDESLLVEAFDPANDLVTTGNLSEVSEEPDDSGIFNLLFGRGPTSLAIRQDGSVEATDLADYRSFSGLLGRTIRDTDGDENDPIATLYSIASVLAGVTVTAEKVNGSRLVLAGVAGDREKSEDIAAITFAPGLFDLDSLTAATQDSIVVRAGTQLEARDSIALTAAAVGQPSDTVTSAMGAIHFEGTHADGVTRLQANTISLTAGPATTLVDPNDDDGNGPVLDPDFLPTLDLSGLDELVLEGDAETSALRLRQNASFDTTRGGSGDFLTALEAGADVAGEFGAEWNELELVSFQGELRVSEIGLLAGEASTLIARTGVDGTLVVDMPNQPIAPAIFDRFADGARFESNDITFRSSDPGTSIDLASDSLLIVSLALTGFQNPNDAGRLRSDMAADDDEEDTVLRPIVRIHQAAAFTDSELPRPNQYASLSLFGETQPRSSLAGLDIELRTTTPGTTLTLDNDVRARTTGSNLILRSAADVAISLSDRTPGYEDLPDYAALQLSTLEILANAGAGAIRVQPFSIGGLPADLTLETEGDQLYVGTVALENTLVTTGRNINFASDVTQSGAPGAGLVVGTFGKVRFAGNVGSAANRLDRLWLLFDGSSGSGSDARTPTVEFGRRIDTNGDGIAETPIDSDQSVFTENDILFVASDLPTRTLIDALNDPDPNVADDGIDSVDTLAELDILLRQPNLELGRERPANFATVGKALGDLLFDSLSGLFTTAPGEKLSVGGNLSIAASGALAAFSDVSALSFQVDAGQIGLLRRDAGVTLDSKGETHRDGGPAIVANTFDSGGSTPSVIGRGRAPRFGLPDPFSASNDFPFLDAFPVFSIRPGGRTLTAADFQFVGGSDELAEQVPFLMPTGPSRSDLSGAYGPVRVPTSKAELADPMRLANPDRLRALAVEARPMQRGVVLARLEGAAVIDDRGLASDGASAVVTESRLDAQDAEAAIGLYDRLFGEHDERAAHVRDVLQNALDQYNENHRSQRVVGFELRRFVKNRPSTLIEAYTTLEDLDTLFRYHRRLGLSPGEFKRIQLGWLEKIQPEGIALDELAETIHPSRYVRGSDILDIFGQ